MDIEKGKTVDPEEVRGREFRVPSIIEEGSGKGFQFYGLHLPHGWGTATDRLKEINWNRLLDFFTSVCDNQEVQLNRIQVDPKSGVLTNISVKTNHIASLQLAREFPYNDDGIYYGINVRNLKAAIALQRCAGTFLHQLWDAVQPNFVPYFSLIDGSPGHYYSYRLEIPTECLISEKPFTYDNFQETFKLGANNIAGRFGLTLRTIHFDQMGLLRSFDIEEGNACGYYLNPNKLDGMYYGHNVDTPEQVATLHGIGSLFINKLMKLQDKVEGWY